MRRVDDTFGVPFASDRARRRVRPRYAEGLSRASRIGGAMPLLCATRNRDEEAGLECGGHRWGRSGGAVLGRGPIGEVGGAHRDTDVGNAPVNHVAVLAVCPEKAPKPQPEFPLCSIIPTADSVWVKLARRSASEQLGPLHGPAGPMPSPRTHGRSRRSSAKRTSMP